LAGVLCFLNFWHNPLPSVCAPSVRSRRSSAATSISPAWGRTTARVAATMAVTDVTTEAGRGDKGQESAGRSVTRLKASTCRAPSKLAVEDERFLQSIRLQHRASGVPLEDGNWDIRRRRFDDYRTSRTNTSAKTGGGYRFWRRLNSTALSPQPTNGLHEQEVSRLPLFTRVLQAEHLPQGGGGREEATSARKRPPQTHDSRRHSNFLQTRPREGKTRRLTRGQSRDLEADGSGCDLRAGDEGGARSPASANPRLTDDPVFDPFWTGLQEVGKGQQKPWARQTRIYDPRPQSSSAGQIASAEEVADLYGGKPVRGGGDRASERGRQGARAGEGGQLQPGARRAVSPAAPSSPSRYIPPSSTWNDLPLRNLSIPCGSRTTTSSSRPMLQPERWPKSTRTTRVFDSTRPLDSNRQRRPDRQDMGITSGVDRFPRRRSGAGRA